MMMMMMMETITMGDILVMLMTPMMWDRSFEALISYWKHQSTDLSTKTNHKDLFATMVPMQIVDF
jgi:hypothetical protein